MLGPFTQADAKSPKRRAKGSKQLSLFTVKFSTGSPGAGAPLSEAAERFTDLTPLWSRSGARTAVEDVAELAAKAGAMSNLIEQRLAPHFAQTRKAGLRNPADVAAYLVLREVDDKALKEVPKHRLNALDFGVTAIIEEHRSRD